MQSWNMKACLVHPQISDRPSNQRPLFSEVGDIQKTSDKLMFALISLKFPACYDETG